MHWNMLFIVPLALGIVVFFFHPLGELVGLRAGPLSNGACLVVIGYSGLRITPDLYPMPVWMLIGPCLMIAGCAVMICALHDRLRPPAAPPTHAELLRLEAQANLRGDAGT